MYVSGVPANSALVVDLADRRGARPSLPIIGEEPAWRIRPSMPEADPAEARVIATRWRSMEEQTREVSADPVDDGYVVGIVMRNMNLRLAVSGRTVLDGSGLPGMLHVTEPGAAVRGVFRGPFDALHLHVPTTVVADCVQDMPGPHSTTLRSKLEPSIDPVTERLGSALLRAEDLGRPFRQLYADCITIAIVARLLATTDTACLEERPKAGGLPKWRLRRATDYIEAHLAGPVGLANLASAAGLTRMHFAAQFKASTGLRPHEYLLRRRIERAQEMLRGPNMSVVDIALAVGFQTQAHFTSIFKRFVGQPPHAWRQAQYDAA
jgi:AraC-like DNA-binding protein